MRAAVPKQGHQGTGSAGAKEETMFEELYEPLPDPGRYWERLRIDPSTLSCSRTALDRIVFAHQCAIPFENLDACEYHVPISLGIGDLFDKIILGNRGGYCFELNALFAALLAEAGFSVAPCYARSLKNRGYVQPVAHRGTIVTIEGRKLFCDVGYGGPMPACALPLEDGFEVSSCGQTFRIERIEGPWWRILYCGRSGAADEASSEEKQVVRAGVRPEGGAAAGDSQAARGDAAEQAHEAAAQPEGVLAFMDVAQYEVDFVALSLYCSTHPNSIFTQQRMLNRRTETGNVSITADRFLRLDNGAKEQRIIESDDEFRQLAETYFGIELPCGRR